MKRKAVVIGATGLIGKALVGQLLNEPAYTKVTVIVRRTIGINHSKLDEKIISFDQLEQMDVNLEEADVFCTLGTTIKKAGTKEAFRLVDYSYPLTLGRMAKVQGARRFLIVTAMGANASSRIFYSRVKGDIEETLRDLNLLALDIFRPSLLLGDREEVRMGERIFSAVSGLYSPFLAGPLRKYRPVLAQTVAKAMIVAAKKDKSGVRIYESDDILQISEYSNI